MIHGPSNVKFTPVVFILVPMAKLARLGNYRKYLLHIRKRGPGKLRNKDFATELLAYCPSSLVVPQEKSTSLQDQNNDNTVQQNSN